MATPSSTSDDLLASTPACIGRRPGVNPGATIHGQAPSDREPVRETPGGMTPVAVMYAIATWGVGGTPRHLLEVLGHLDRCAFAPSLYCFDTRRQPEALLPLHALHIDLIDGRQRGSLRGPALAGFVLRLARELSADVCKFFHSYLFEANFVATLAGRLAKVPVVMVSKRQSRSPPAGAQASGRPPG